MSIFLERLRAALGADYDVMEELASGGMGTVYRARDRALDRLVAIKIIRPDLATAAASERFLREARLMASFSHPNIVPIHRAGEADGMAYYVMDYLAGETLADRLLRGPLSPQEFGLVAGDLLAALEVVHTHGIVHRDVKPSNIFLTGARAMLSDFGISKAATGDSTTLTETGHSPGTPGYMPPEQHSGNVSERTDVCAAGMVLFEAATGKAWSFDSHTEQADWSRVPGSAAPAIRRALAWSPAERWANGGEFRSAMTSHPARSRMPMIAGIVVLVAAIVTAMKVWPPLPVPHHAVRIRIHPLVVEGGSDAALGDSIAVRLVRALSGAVDFDVALAGPGPNRDVDVELAGSVRDSAGIPRIQMHDLRSPSSATPITMDRRGAGAVVDSLAYDVLFGVYRSRDDAFEDLPRDAMPRSPNGLALLARGEALYAQAQWRRASNAYDEALRADSTCALCDLRMMTISQWLRGSPDSFRTKRVLAAQTRFPARYQLVILAGTAREDRWSAREALVTRWPRFDLGHFIYGDEIFHRGPLSGRPRAQAQEHFRAVTDLRPSFAPGWEHLAWVSIADGDAPAALEAFGRYQATAADDPEALVVQAVLGLGLAWRFGPTDSVAEALTRRILAEPNIARVPDLRFGPHYLLGFDAPEGVVFLGQRYAAWPGRTDLKAPGLVGQITGLLALGRLDSARLVIGRLQAESPDAEYALAAAEFEAAYTLADPDPVTRLWPRLRTALTPLTRDGSGSVEQRRRAAWMLTLLARRAGDSLAARQWRERVSGESAPHPLSALLEAQSIASGDPGRALRQSEPLLALDSAGRAGDPFYRAMLHLLRADWRLAASDTTAAERELLWYENYDVTQLPDMVQAVDGDWALGTLARWRRAQLSRTDGGHEICRALAGVVRLWKRADPPYAARARTAAAEHQRLHCPEIH